MRGCIGHRDDCTANVERNERERIPSFTKTGPNTALVRLISARLATRAKEHGTTVNELVNKLLTKDMELIQVAAG